MNNPQAKYRTRETYDYTSGQRFSEAMKTYENQVEEERQQVQQERPDRYQPLYLQQAPDLMSGGKYEYRETIPLQSPQKQSVKDTSYSNLEQQWYQIPKQLRGQQPRQQEEPEYRTS